MTSAVSVARRAGYVVRPIAGRAMRPIAARAWSRAPLNVVYRHLGGYAKRIFFGGFHQAFQRGSDFPIDPGWWTIDFAGKTLKLPLVPERMWLDWYLALATLGTDYTVKKTYAAIVSSSRKPDLFLDVGANYGTHSLLFLARIRPRRTRPSGQDGDTRVPVLIN